MIDETTKNDIAELQMADRLEIVKTSTNEPNISERTINYKITINGAVCFETHDAVRAIDVLQELVEVRNEVKV